MQPASILPACLPACLAACLEPSERTKRDDRASERRNECELGLGLDWVGRGTTNRGRRVRECACSSWAQPGWQGLSSRPSRSLYVLMRTGRASAWACPAASASCLTITIACCRCTDYRSLSVRPSPLTCSVAPRSIAHRGRFLPGTERSQAGGLGARRSDGRGRTRGRGCEKDPAIGAELAETSERMNERTNERIG